jgi:hypothetical protein
MPGRLALLSLVGWAYAEDIFVQRQVIFPRIHVARNVRRRNRNAQHFLAVRVEQSAQSAFWIKME